MTWIIYLLLGLFIGWLLSKAYYRRIVRAELELMLDEGVRRENDMRNLEDMRNMREKYLEDWGDHIAEMQLEELKVKEFEEKEMNDGNTK